MLDRILPTVIFFTRHPGWHPMPSHSAWRRAVHTVAKYGYVEIDEAGEKVRLVENPELSALFSECETIFSKSEEKEDSNASL